MVGIRGVGQAQVAIVRGLIRDSGTLPPARGFEWRFAVLATWLMAGGYLDAWAHRHLARLETFFTPWHAVLYSGMFAIMIFLGSTALRNQARGRSLANALPAGYGLSLLGCVLFAIGGVIDMFWHRAFGFEVNIAALISPPHLLLMLALGLIVTGPLRAAWRRPGSRAPYTAVLSATILVSMLTFFDQFDQPLVNVWAATHGSAPVAIRYVEQLGILGIMVQTALLTGIVLYLLRRFTLPFGSLTLLAGINGALLSSLEDNFGLIPMAVAGGLLADLVLYWLKPGPQRVRALRAAAFLAPAAVCALYMLVLAVTRGITWPAHLWLGSIFVAGAIGWLLSYLSVPPPIPVQGDPVRPVGKGPVASGRTAPLVPRLPGLSAAAEAPLPEPETGPGIVYAIGHS
jgi:hypothetical protein